MKYADIIPHWYRVNDSYVLIDQEFKRVGDLKRIGNQIHWELLRQAENKQQEVKR